MNKEEALKIIIKKNVNIKWLKIFAKTCPNVDFALKCYNDECRESDRLTKEEFELLKEIIKNV